MHVEFLWIYRSLQKLSKIKKDLTYCTYLENDNANKEESNAFLNTPAEVKEPTGHSRVILFLFLELSVAFQPAFSALVQMRSHIDAGAILEEGLPRLLQLPHLTHIFQYRLTNYKAKHLLEYYKQVTRQHFYQYQKVFT